MKIKPGKAIKTVLLLVVLSCIPIAAYAREDSDIEKAKHYKHQMVGKPILSSTKPGVSESPKVSPHPLLAALKNELEPELKKLNPKATFESPEGCGGQCLTVRFDTKDYVVHVKTMRGPTQKTITSEGPSDRGFLLRVYLQPLGEMNQAVVPQVIQDEYWKTYLNVYPVKNTQHQLYFCLSYNTGTDKVVMDKIKKVAEQLHGKVPVTATDRLALRSNLVGGNNSNPTPSNLSTSKPSWSEPINGLRARLEVLPPEKEVSPSENHGPFCRVYIEFQNVSDVAGNMRIRFAPDKLKLSVVDQNGKKLATADGPYDGMSPLWEEPMLVPYDGTLKFRVSFPGLGYMPSKDKIIVDMGPSRSWVVPQDGSTYYLSGSLEIEKEEGDHPHMDWSGTLKLPKAAIPKVDK